jgi:hypothetical protein
MEKLLNEIAPLMDRQTVEIKDESYSVVTRDVVFYHFNCKNGIYIKDGTSEIFDHYMTTFIFKRTPRDGKSLEDMNQSSNPFLVLLKCCRKVLVMQTRTKYP